MLLRGVRPSPRTSGTLAPMAVDYDPPAGWLPNQTRHPGWRIETVRRCGGGGTSDQAPRLRAARHFPQPPLEILRGDGEAVAQGFQRAILAFRLRVPGHPHEDAGDPRLGFLVPMRLPGLAGGDL